MRHESLSFEELHIRQAPGFEREGFTVGGLSAGINVIHGPNGAGKSTTGRAVARLLWPALEGPDRVSLRGRFRLAGAEWSIDLDGARAQYQREGVPATAPLLPSGDGHQRYQLSLHDLLRARDEGFASAVARESAGGYDVRRTGAVLEPRTLVSRRNALNDALDRARADYDEAIALQQELRAQERDLAKQREALEAAQEAQRQVTVLQAALDHARALEAELVARAKLDRFAAAMERVGGDEYDRLCRLRESVRKVGEARRVTEKAAAEARVRVKRLALPDEALREELLRGLEEDLERLQAADQEVERARSALARALARRESEAARLGDSVDAERLSGAGLAAIANVADFVRRANALAARRNTVESQLRLVSVAASAGDPARFEEGTRLLRRWLREPVAAAAVQGGGRGRMAGILAAVSLVGFGFVLAAAGERGYALVAALGLALLAAMLWPRAAAPPVADAREVHRRDFQKLELGDPAAWDARAVEVLLGELEECGVRAREEATQQRKRREIEDELAAIATEEDRLEVERVGISASLGVAPPESRPVELAWVMETLVRWQAAQSEVLGEEAALRAAASRASACEESLRARLEAIGYGPLAGHGELAGAIRDLGERRQQLQAARAELRSAEDTLGRLREDCDRQEQEIERLFGALGLDAGSDETVRDWCEARGDYRAALEAHRHAESVRSTARGRLELLGAEEALATLPAGEIEQLLATEKERAAQRDALAQAITATETLIDRAKRSHDVEEALERVDQAEEDLRRAREKDVRGAVAQELIDAVERATRDQQLPAVFRRARELFSRITQGRYELRLRQEGSPEFSAFDQIERRGRGLDQLSSGTRVQLLLAVRVAFVEQQEQGVMLPLLLDEVLGNSDDERARAIMEAAVELAREGRQIFYFTAQMDEVARWRALVGEGLADGVELREIDLMQVRGLERQLEIPFVVPPARPRPPAPAGADHAEYGRRLSVPRLDRATSDASAVHLWYLVEEPETLHRLLLLGADRWGPLDALIRDGGRPLIDDQLYDELQLRGRIVEAFLEAAATGVGRPVDLAALEDSGAVSDTFLDRVESLARSLHGDAADLMDALEEGQAPRFSRANKDALRAYLEQWGYLPREAPLGLEEVRTAVLSRVAAEIAAGRVSLEQVDRLVGRLWLGVGGELSRETSHHPGA